MTGWLKGIGSLFSRAALAGRMVSMFNLKVKRIMKKKDYSSLQSKYSFLKDTEELYRKKLFSFFIDAFEKHGGVFELKPEGCATWEERKKALDFFPTDELPYCVALEVKDGELHEIYISRIRQKICEYGVSLIELDGWDWQDCDFVKGCSSYYNLESLSVIADFINGVLQKEQDEWIKVGVKCKWNDPAIDDYDESDRAEVLNRVWTIERIEGEVILLSTDGGEAEVFAHEIEPV